jgi:hypothetical protein
MRITFPAILCLLVFSAAAIANPPFTVSPETTAITGPLRPDGSVDYVAAINREYGQGVTPENNGFIDFMLAAGPKTFPRSTFYRMISMLGVKNVQKDVSGWTQFQGNGPMDDGILRLWKADDFPAFADDLKKQGRWLDLASQGAAKPRWYVPAISLTGASIQVLLPELSWMRGMTLSLCARALWRANDGDFGGFLADVMAAKRLSRNCNGYTLVGRRVAAGCDDLADRTIGAAVGAGIFNSAQCEKLAQALDALPPPAPVWVTVDEGRRWNLLDSTQWVAMGKLGLLITGNADYDRNIMRLKEVDRQQVDWDSVMRQINTMVDQEREILKAGPVRDEIVARGVFDLQISTMGNAAAAQRSLAPQPGERRNAYTQRISDWIIATWLASAWKVEDECRWEVLEDEVTRAAVGAAKYHADNGVWPKSLPQLVPQYLPRVPVEIFSTPDPVRYQVGDAGIRLTTRGARGSDISIGVSRQMPTDGL